MFVTDDGKFASDVARHSMSDMTCGSALSVVPGAGAAGSGAAEGEEDWP